jgi:DNA invertase Pin-like site-specific DNA recombinase
MAQSQKKSGPKKTGLVVVAYLRVSGRGQVDGYGFDRQQETINAWARHAGATVERTYREEGVSGTKDETHRPAFSEMVEDLLSNGCRTIVVESLDRFARDLGVQMQLLAYLLSKGLRLISASTGDDVTAAMEDDPMRKAMVQMQGVFSELDKNLTVRKLKKARATKKAETGRCEGQKPFGHYPGEADTVEMIRSLYRKPHGERRRSLREVCDILNGITSVPGESQPRRFSTRTGKAWSKQVLHQIIKRGLRAE